MRPFFPFYLSRGRISEERRASAPAHVKHGSQSFSAERNASLFVSFAFFSHHNKETTPSVSPLCLQGRTCHRCFSRRAFKGVLPLALAGGKGGRKCHGGIHPCLRPSSFAASLRGRGRGSRSRSRKDIHGSGRNHSGQCRRKNTDTETTKRERKRDERAQRSQASKRKRLSQREP